MRIVYKIVNESLIREINYILESYILFGNINFEGDRNTPRA